MSPLKSRKARLLTAAACVIGSACASGPLHRPPPPPEECPAGAAETFKQLQIIPGQTPGVVMGPRDWSRPPPSEYVVSEGPASVEIVGPWGLLPHGTPLYGELIFGKGRVHGRFTQVRLPGGELLPFCFELNTDWKMGIPMLPGSTSEKVRISNHDLYGSAVKNFH